MLLGAGEGAGPFSNVVTQPIRAVLLSIGLLVLIPANAWAQWTVSSPNGSTSISVSLNPSTGALSYSVTQGGAVVLESSALGISTSVGDFSNGLSFVSRGNTVINESYSLITKATTRPAAASPAAVSACRFWQRRAIGGYCWPKATSGGAITRHS